MNSNSVDILDLLAALNANKRLIFGGTVLICLLATGISFMLPKEYRGDVQLLPPKEEKKGFGFADLLSALPIPSLRLGEKGTPADIFVAILESSTLQRRMVGDFDLMQIYEVDYMANALEILESKTEVGKSEEGTIIISVLDRDPKRSMDMANHYVTLLDATNQHLTRTEAQERYEFIQKLKQTEEAKLEQAMQRLQEFQAEHNAISIEDQAKAVIQAGADYQMTATQLLITRNSLLLSGFSPTHPQVQKVEQEFLLWQEALAFLRDGDEIGGKSPLGEKIADKLELEENLFLPLRMIPEMAQEYAVVEKDVLVQAALIKLLLEQEAEALIEANNTTTTVQVLDKATLPEKKARPRRFLIVFVASILSLFATVSFVIGGQYVGGLKKRWESDYRKKA